MDTSQMEALAAAAISADVREGSAAADAIDGIVPGVIVEPHTPEATAATLAWATEHHLSW